MRLLRLENSFQEVKEASERVLWADAALLVRQPWQAHLKEPVHEMLPSIDALHVRVEGLPVMRAAFVDSSLLLAPMAIIVQPLFEHAIVARCAFICVQLSEQELTAGLIGAQRPETCPANVNDGL